LRKWAQIRTDGDSRYYRVGLFFLPYGSPGDLMTRILTMLMTAAALHAATASAEWRRAGENDDMVVYTDSATTKRAGNLARLWQLNDLKAEGSTAVTMSAGEWYLSTRLQLEFDCVANKVRILSFAAHTAKMGNGKVVLADNEAQAWGAISRDPINLTLYKMACNKS
jgi:hypothetical protein